MASRGGQSWAEVHAALVLRAAPCSVLIDSRYDVLQLSPGVSAFLQLAQGPQSLSLLQLVHDDFRFQLGSALVRAAESGKQVRVDAAPWKDGNLVDLRVYPDVEHGLFLVSFESRGEAAPVENPSLLQGLLRELEHTRDELSRTVERHAGSIATGLERNEELAVLNEELRASGEHLESKAEELERLNLELACANRDLQLNLHQVLRVNTELEELMSATALAIVFLDSELRLVHFTPAASALFQLIAEDVRRPFGHLQSVLDYPELLADARQVVEGGAPLEREVGASQGRRFLTRLSPYRRSDWRIAGVSLTCLDVTGSYRARELLQRARDQLEATVRQRTLELDRLNVALQEQLQERYRNELVRDELRQRLVVAQEQERARISRELHDGVGQRLTALMLGLKQLEQLPDVNPPLSAKLSELRSAVGEVSRELHELALAIRPTSLDDLGLLRALSQQLERWAASSGLAVDFQSRGLEAERLPSHVETAIYRIAQEGLNNVLKHAGASNVAVTLERLANSLLFVVEDDGNGFEPPEPDDACGAQLGLAGMRERASLLGGTLTIESGSGRGTTILLRLPIPATIPTKGADS